MKILLIGGRVFLGRHVIDAAVERGHEVTMLNRGRHNAELYPAVEKLRADRVGDLSVLDGREWDVVIDTCGYLPSHVRASAERLAHAVGHYVFISSISVYERFDPSGTDEDGQIRYLTGDQVREAESIDTGERPTAVVYGEMYGGLKALCEKAAEVVMPGRVLNIRPGLLSGPYDTTDRFTYWVERVARGDEVLAPGDPARRVRIIDARDVAEWTIRMAEERRVGTFNASGAEDGLSMKWLLHACKAVSGSDASFIWASDKFLTDRKVGPWVEMPLWLPEAHNSIFEVKNNKAIEAGLTFRPIEDTVRDTLEWCRSRPSDYEPSAGMHPDRERKLLSFAREIG